MDGASPREGLPSTKCVCVCVCVCVSARSPQWPSISVIAASGRCFTRTRRNFVHLPLGSAIFFGPFQRKGASSSELVIAAVSTHRRARESVCVCVCVCVCLCGGGMCGWVVPNHIWYKEEYARRGFLLLRRRLIKRHGCPLLKPITFVLLIIIYHCVEHCQWPFAYQKLC